MTTKTKEVRIGAITLTNGGNKGIVVTYEQTEIRNNREFFTEVKAKKKFPIHEGLDIAFKMLRQHLLGICNYTTDTEFLIGGTEITGIKYNNEGFVLSGTLSTIGDKTFPLSTPLITLEDGHPDFDTICAILDTIYSETKEYMDGKKVLSDIEYVINLNKSNKDFDVKTFENLSQAEQWKIANDFMAKNKCIVTKLDDLELDEEEPIVNIPFVQTEEVIAPPTIESVYEFNEETFVLPVEEVVVKKSTAKKIKA